MLITTETRENYIHWQNIVRQILSGSCDVHSKITGRVSSFAEVQMAIIGSNILVKKRKEAALSFINFNQWENKFVHVLARNSTRNFCTNIIIERLSCMYTIHCIVLCTGAFLMIRWNAWFMKVSLAWIVYRSKSSTSSIPIYNRFYQPININWK